MRLCYIDESGDTGAFTLDNVNSQPVFLLTAWFMSRALSILEHNDCRIVSRIFVKGVGEDFDGTSVYASAVQKMITGEHSVDAGRGEIWYNPSLPLPL